MLKKLLDMNVRCEAIILLFILGLLIYIFVRIVVPNFGTKALPAAWATMFGAFVIFSYSLFFELEEEVLSMRFNTYAVSGDKLSLPNFLIPPDTNKGSSIERNVDAGNLNRIQPWPGGHPIDLIDVGKELLFINTLSFIGAGYMDWKIDKISYPFGHTLSARSPDSAGEDSLIYERDLIARKKFKYFMYSNRKSVFGSGASIYPPGTQVLANEKIHIQSKEFDIEIYFESPGHIYKSGHMNVAPFEVRVQCVLPKNRAGSLNRKTSKEFCSDFMTRLSARLKVEDANFPKRG